MLVRVICSELLDALERVLPFVAKKPALPIIGYVHLAVLDTRLEVTGRGYSTHEVAYVHCCFVAEGEPRPCVVGPHVVIGALRTLPPNAELTLCVDRLDFLIRCERPKSLFRFYGQDAAEYPLPVRSRASA